MLKLSDIDQVLIRYADTLSPEAIAAKIDNVLSPAQVRARITTLLQNPDWLTLAMQDQLITQKMRLIITELEDLPRTTRNGEVLLAGLDRVGARLEKRAAATESDLKQLYSFQGTVMLDAVTVALEHLKGELAIPDAQWNMMLENALRYASIEISKHEQGAELELTE